MSFAAKRKTPYEDKWYILDTIFGGLYRNIFNTKF